MLTARVKIECSFFHDGFADWEADCTCGEEMFAGDWPACMEWALGHLCLRHGGAS